MRIGEVDPAGAIICQYLSGSAAPSPVGRIGLPGGGSGGTAYIDMMAEIGGALGKVKKEEARLTGKSTKYNILVRRWANYMLMVQHRNALKSAEKQALLALRACEAGVDCLSVLQEQEEAVLHERAAYKKHKKENDRLRRSPLYLKMMGIFAEELERRGIWT